MVEAKIEARVRRTPRAGAGDEARYEARYESSRDESSRYDRHGSATLSRLTQALGGCATEFATGSVRVAGGLVTDLCGAVLEPFDRLLGTGRRARERAQYEDERSERGVGRSLDRAVSGMADTASRSEDRFRETLEGDREPGLKADYTAPGDQGPAFDRGAEREHLESQTVAELKETADKEGIDLGDAHLKADIVNKMLRARASKAAAESKS